MVEQIEFVSLILTGLSLGPNPESTVYISL